MGTKIFILIVDQDPHGPACQAVASRRSYVSVTVWERGRLGARETRQTARFQIRTAATRAGLENSPWSGPGGVNAVFQESGAEIGPVPAEHRWIQYKATLISPNCANSPVLRRVEIGL